MNKSSLIGEVKDRLDVTGARAKTLVEAVLDEMRHAVEQGQSLTLRGLGFTPDRELRDTWAAATERPDTAPAPDAVHEPTVVPYDPPRDPLADAVAAAAAEQGRPHQPEVVVDLRVLPTMAEPELLAKPATLAYSSGEADTDETIADLTAR
jgi:hypothetical protein